MIGCVLFYGLYPLSRLLKGQSSETSTQDPSVALLNGTAVCDGGAVGASELTSSETAPLEEQRCPGADSGGELAERMIVQRRGETGSGADQKHCLTVNANQNVNQEQFDLTAALEDSPKVHNEVNSSDNGVAAKDEGPVTQPIICKELSPTVTHAQSALYEQSEQLQTENKRDTACSDQFEIHNLKDLLASPAAHTEGATSHEWAHDQFDNAALPSECWDEYIAVAEDTSKGASESCPILVIPPVDSCEVTDMSPTRLRPAQPVFHFAVGPGLTNEVQCPLWRFPTPSYYPTMESTHPFEVMWRLWEDMEECSSASAPELVPFPLTKTVNFTVMSYNILSQDLLEANQDLYTHCPLEVLEWSVRCRLLIEEIERWTPEILCLQEVQENHFIQQLHPVLSEMGYTCTYKKRTGTKMDGCATCYRSSAFAELSIVEVEYFRPEIELLDRHNVAIIVLLRPMMTLGSELRVGPPLCVANTHLLFNPRRGDIKLAQLAILLAEIDKVVKSCKSKGEHCNIILCGDFNSVPHTPLYDLITKGELYYQGLPAWLISGQEDLSYKPHFQKLYGPLWPDSLGITDRCQFASANQVFESHEPKAGSLQYSHEFLLQLRFCPAASERPADLEMIPGVTDITPDLSKDSPSTPRSTWFRQFLSHRLHLQSVYKHVLPGSGNAEVTTLHSQVGATVDYIFFSPRCTTNTEDQEEGNFARCGLRPIGCLSLLSEDTLWSMNGLPSHIFPSDHLSLLAKFEVDIN